MKRFAVPSLIFLALATAIVAAADTPITTGTLVSEMVDMKRLAEFPSPAFRTVQFSSYDRRSQVPGGPDWFANSDGFGREPIPNFEAVITEPDADGIGEYLICDVKGPGAVVRTWTAAIEGTIRVYLDGSDQPLYDGRADDFLLHPWKSFNGDGALGEGTMDGTFEQRNAAYCPIPFAKRLRITWVGNPQKIHFYQIQVRLYEPGASVSTFEPGDLSTYASPIRAVAEILADPGEKWRYTSNLQETAIAATIEASSTGEILSIEGPAAVERLTLKVRAGHLDQALRQTVLHIIADGHPWGQVQAPIGDFFGAAPGINPYNSVPFTVEPDGTMTCRYWMPFARSLRVVIENKGNQRVTVTGSALPAEYTWQETSSMHFRALWRTDHDLVASNKEVQDLPYLVANGQGVYVGTAAMLLNPTPVPTPGGGWWGEGDEKIFVDGDIRPSTFGTGSEDYFNYAWSSPDIFVFPYCGQPRNDGPGNRGFVTNQRWHVLDRLPFQKDIAFYMELFSHERTEGVSYARIGYHYAKPGIRDDHLPITTEDVRRLELPTSWEPAPRGQARNSTFYDVETIAVDPSKCTLSADNLWSGGQVCTWSPSEAGDSFEISIPVTEEGKHRLHLGLALSGSSGTVSVAVDGRPAGFGGDSGEIELQAPHRTLLRHYSSGDLELEKGNHLLEIKLVAPAPSGQPTTIGIDYAAVQRPR